MIIHFNTMSLTFFISNVLASFFIGPILILGFINLIVSLINIEIAKIIAVILEFLLEVLINIAKFSSKIPFSKILVTTPSTFIILIYEILLFLPIILNNIKNSRNYIYKKIVFIIKKYYKKVLSLILIIIFISKIIPLLDPKIEIYFIDVGQGDCTFIITETNKKILIDGGGSSDSSFDIGEKVLVPYLLSHNTKTIDYIIVSHFDTDHVGGLFTIMKELKVKNVIVSKQVEDSENYQKFKEIVKEKNIKVIVVGKSDILKIDKNVYFEILWPNNSKLINENVLNNNSIVCKLHYNNFSMFFTGDIEEIAEKQILEEYKNNLNIFNSTVLKVAHHGSKTSSIKEFIEAAKPKIALIGVSENNKFGHPNDGVVERIESFRNKDLPYRSNGRNFYNSK